MNEHEKLNYVEFPARDLPATREFFNTVFGWEFEEFGPDYCAFSGQGLDGGFYRSELYSSTHNGSALLVFYSDDIEMGWDGTFKGQPMNHAVFVVQINTINMVGEESKIVAKVKLVR